LGGEFKGMNFVFVIFLIMNGEGYGLELRVSDGLFLIVLRKEMHECNFNYRERFNVKYYWIFC
jgi:hypothetical protein